jgi:hypothetical protein
MAYCSSACWKNDYHSKLCGVLLGYSDPKEFDEWNPDEDDLEEQIQLLKQAPSVDGRAGKRKRRWSPRRLSRSKARKLLKDGTIRGKPLTARQRRFFGWVAAGK